MQKLATTAICSFAVLAGIATAQDIGDAGPDVIWIGLENATAAEATTASELRAMMRSHDLDRWILTRRVLIDETQTPHSHPILTIHTRYIGSNTGLAAMFLHEQLHWLEAEPWLSGFRAAMEEYESLFPEVPSAADGGARDTTSTYRHLLVCDMEYQAMTALFGKEIAQQTLLQYTHYAWIYEKVLEDPRIREVALRHGFDVYQGIPSR